MYRINTSFTIYRWEGGEVMAKEYIPKVWENYKTPILDEDLNHIENGLKEATDAINDEQTARTNADNAFQQSIDNEVSARTSADKSLQDSIDNESLERTNADNAIKESLAAEKTARETADSTLQRNIENEKSAREQADTALQNAINAETSAREQADTNLQANIDNAGIKMNLHGQTIPHLVHLILKLLTSTQENIKY